MEYIQLTEENIEKEHILCISIVSGFLVPAKAMDMPTICLKGVLMM